MSTSGNFGSMDSRRGRIADKAILRRYLYERMKALDSPNREALALLAKRLVWWKTPAEALADPNRFLAQLMTFGTWNDLQEAMRVWPEDRLRTALQNAPAGVFDRRSWSYWHHRLDLLPVPPLPARKLPEN